jgi:hypothetical protein
VPNNSKVAQRAVMSIRKRTWGPENKETVRVKGGHGLDAKVRDLTTIALVSLFSLGLAWAYEADFFAMFFAAAAAMAGVEAVRRSL